MAQVSDEVFFIHDLTVRKNKHNFSFHLIRSAYTRSVVKGFMYFAS